MSEIEDLLLAKITKEELDLAVSNKIEEMHGLVDREKALSLIAIEKGLIKSQKTKVSDLRDGLKGINLEARVDYVSELVKTQKSSFRDIGLISNGEKAVLRLWGTKYNEFRLIYGDDIELGNCSYSYNAVQLGSLRKSTTTSGTARQCWKGSAGMERRWPRRSTAEFLKRCSDRNNRKSPVV
ncbi:MAG: hypothetical protein NTY68_03250 [Candidatus Micrarchaeota archaeon]|nr:hypothetical protein [Candidatus Micrarchaeota archaeon]